MQQDHIDRLVREGIAHTHDSEVERMRIGIAPPETPDLAREYRDAASDLGARTRPQPTTVQPFAAVRRAR